MRGTRKSDRRSVAFTCHTHKKYLENNSKKHGGKTLHERKFLFRHRNGKFHCSMLTCALLLCMQSDTDEFFDSVRGIREEHQKLFPFDHNKV